MSQRSESRAHFFGEEFGLLPRREVTTLFNLVEMDELGKRLLGPTPGSWIQFVRKNAHCHRNPDALCVEISELAPILPIEPRAGYRGVREPGNRDVVENVVAREPFGFSIENARDQLVAACVMVQEIRGQADR